MEVGGAARRNCGKFVTMSSNLSAHMQFTVLAADLRGYTMMELNEYSCKRLSVVS